MQIHVYLTIKAFIMLKCIYKYMFIYTNSILVYPNGITKPYNFVALIT